MAKKKKPKFWQPALSPKLREMAHKLGESQQRTATKQVEHLIIMHYDKLVNERKDKVAG